MNLILLYRSWVYKSEDGKYYRYTLLIEEGQYTITALPSDISGDRILWRGTAPRIEITESIARQTVINFLSDK